MRTDPRIAPRRAFEQHMLNHMGNAILGKIFMARANADPNAERNRMHARHSIGNNAQTIRQCGGLKSAHFMLHFLS